MELTPVRGWQRAKSPKRWRRIGAGAFATLIVALMLAFAGVARAQPAIAAIACPQCFGFQRVQGNFFVDREMPAGTRAALLQAEAEARQRVAKFYGGYSGDPVILACSDAPCYQRLGLTRARAVSYGTYGIRVSPRGLNAVILAHELSHVELGRRIGFRQAWFGAVPAWFNEGLAVVVSDDERYLLPEGTDGSRCRVSPQGSLPRSERAWNASAGNDGDLYARAACNVVLWLNASGGAPAAASRAVAETISRIRAGERFSDVYQTPPITKTQ